MEETGLFHFFGVTARVTIGTTMHQVWAHLSAEYVTILPSSQVTYAQVVAGSPKVICSIGFMWDDLAAPEPKKKRILVGYPLSVGWCDWEQVAGQWRIDCPVDTAPQASTNILMANALDMVKAVLAPSFGCSESEVEVVPLRSKFLYFNPHGL